jgi:hypothetical protein
METEAPLHPPRPPRLARVWAGALLPALAWFADLELSLALTRTAAATTRKGFLHAISALCLVVALGGLALSWHEWRVHTRLVADGHTELAASRSVTRWGIALGAFFVLLILGTAVPNFVFHPRDLP